MTRIGAIDQGTTSTRILVADGQNLAIAASFTHATRYPRPGWVEQDALEIAANIERCIATAGRLDAIGLANQGESCLAWDAVTLEPLSPIIVWQDNRTAEALAAMPADAAQAVARLAHLPLDAYFSASKLGWLVREVPAVAAAHRAGRLRLGTTDAFFLDRLAGRFATDRATASRTSLMDFGTGEWSLELCAIFGVPMECLPPILPNIGDFGSIGGVPVRASIVDQQAALYGHGCRKPGDAKITFGTGGFALALTAGSVALAESKGLLPTVAWDLGDGPVHALDGGIYDAGSAIDWAIRAGLAGGISDFQEFDAPAAVERGLVFVPAFSGLAAPEWDRLATPLLIGLSPETSRADICQALLEGIAFSAADVCGAMRAVVPLNAPVIIDGGVSRSPYFAQVLADALGVEVVVRDFADCTALGVAQLVAHSLGETVSRPDPGRDRHHLPRPLTNRLHDRFRRARQLARGWRD
jgi:glycerol kinase